MIRSKKVFIPGKECEFVAYIDESGSEKDHGKPGTSEWFVMAAVVFRFEFLNTVRAAVAEMRKHMNRDPDHIFKYDSIQPNKRVAFAGLLAKKPVAITSVFVHKPSLKTPLTSRSAAETYNYIGKLLFERISWVCRDLGTEHIPPSGKCFVVFSERKKFPYDEFREYLQRLARNPGYRCSIDWRFIDPKLVAAIPHWESDNCALADLAASACGAAVEYKEGSHQVTDSRPLLELRSRIKMKGGSVRNVGIKIFPETEYARTQTEDRFHWYRHFLEGRRRG